MPERWLAEMRKIGRMEPIPDLLERAEDGPSLPEPGPRPTSRVGAALLALVITIAGGWMAYAALRDTGGRQPLTSSPSITINRYFFSASGIGGVLEVSSSPPSICYSTQSYPARPIEIVPGPSSTAIAHAEVSYAPRNNDFCDRTVSLTLAADLLANPSGYQVRWHPLPGGPTAFSSFRSSPHAP